ncbi:MAG: TIGR03032 family protein [Myxococcales bacterium]|nr:TIGR03032 family protein [Myxococcales bacterium]MCB9754063.1 TIGR03032 family protein [Myxococcales bacterium]
MSEAPAGRPPIELTGDRRLPDWFAELGGSVAFTTYQAGKLFLIGLQPEQGRLSIFERTFNRCMGLCAHGRGLWMSSLYQLWRFEDALAPGQTHHGYDRVYVPQVGYTTGDVDIHDIAIDGGGRPIFVNTLFSCLATVSETHSFTPLWRPSFISRLAAEDRCHLNGLAMADGRPAYVTAVSESDVVDGWRDRRRDGGVVIDVRSGEVIARGLSMPHSPRLHDGKLWLVEAGSGYLGYIDRARGRFERVTFCPGFTRGLHIHGHHAIVGLSALREHRTFGDLELGARLENKRADARCGFVVIDLRTGDLVHWLRIEGVVRELYDVVILPGARRPMALGFKTDEIRRMITMP